MQRNQHEERNRNRGGQNRNWDQEERRGGGTGYRSGRYSSGQYPYMNQNPNIDFDDEEDISSETGFQGMSSQRFEYGQSYGTQARGGTGGLNYNDYSSRGQGYQNRDRDRFRGRAFEGQGFGGEWTDNEWNGGTASGSEALQRRYQNESSMRGQFTGKGPKGYTRSDERIKEEVCEALSRHGEIDASDIEVEVQDGEVLLKGTVQERRIKRLVEDCVEDLSGVKEVHNQIRVSRQQSEGSQSQQSGQQSSGMTKGLGQQRSQGEQRGQSENREQGERSGQKDHRTEQKGKAA